MHNFIHADGHAGNIKVRLLGRRQLSAEPRLPEGDRELDLGWKERLRRWWHAKASPPRAEGERGHEQDQGLVTALIGPAIRFQMVGRSLG